MDKRETWLAELQRMHEFKSVRRECIIAWYDYHSQSRNVGFLELSPGRYDVDLIRATCLWMELTDQGGTTAFPYDYYADLSFPTVDPEREPRHSAAFPVGVFLIVAGVVTVWFNWKVGTVLALSGPVVLYLGFKADGGASNPDLLAKETSLYATEGRRVLDWVARQSTDVVNHKSWLRRAERRSDRTRR